MWDESDIGHVHDEVDPSIQSTGQSGLNSRASSYMSLQDPDLLSIQNKIDEVEKDFSEVNDLQSFDLNSLHDKLLALKGKVETYATAHPNEDANSVRIMTDNLEKFIGKVNSSRFGATTPDLPNFEFSLPEEDGLSSQVDCEKLCSHFSEQMKNHFLSIDSVIASRVTKSVSQELDRFQKNCMKSKVDIKLKILLYRN